MPEKETAQGRGKTRKAPEVEMVKWPTWGNPCLWSLRFAVLSSRGLEKGTLAPHDITGAPHAPLHTEALGHLGLAML